MNRKAVLLRLANEARPYAPRLVMGLLLGVVAGLAPIAIAPAAGLLISDVLPKHDFRALGLVALLIAGSQIIGNLAGYGQSYLTAYSGQLMIASFRARLFERVLAMPLAGFDRWRPGEFMSRFTSDLGLMTDAVSISLPQLIQTIVTFFGSLGYMIWLDWRLSVVLLGVAPLVGLSVARFSKLISSGTDRAQARVADLSSNLSEVLQNERIVKAFGREHFEAARFRNANEDYFGANMKVTQLNQTQSPVIATIVALALIVIVYATVSEVVAKHLPSSQVLTFWALAASMINPMNRFSIFMGDFARALIGAGRVFEILDLPVERSDPPNAIALPRLTGDVRFEDVTFAYDGAAVPVLDRFSTEMRAGEVVALVGPSGAGKSTIVNLVLRFFEPQSGAITVDGIDIANVRLADLRGQIAIVPQETQLWSGTIADNIRYGRLDATDAEVRAAAREANVEEFVLALPDGYDTMVGERGIRLSGGQRQRVAIARAILRDPRILLLDEATSALDSHSEHLIELALDRLLPGRTTIIIAHRLSTIRRATKILYLEGGVIRETGTHDDLLRKSGSYAALYSAQYSPS
jgi:subfamily B ATP-binding cassette protein MsbA